MFHVYKEVCTFFSQNLLIATIHVGGSRGRGTGGAFVVLPAEYLFRYIYYVYILLTNKTNSSLHAYIQ